MRGFLSGRLRTDDIKISSGMGLTGVTESEHFHYENHIYVVKKLPDMKFQRLVEKKYQGNHRKLVY
jgi:hypothetical protein